MTDSAFKGVNYKKDPTQEPTFLGQLRYRPEVKNVISLLESVDIKLFRRILQFVIEYMKGTDITDTIWGKLKQGSEVSTEDLKILFTGAYYILRSAFRNRIEVSTLQIDLTIKLKVPEPVVKDFCTAYTSSKEAFERSAIEKRIRYPSVADLSWRIDVTITTSAMSRVFKPTILVQLTSTDGKIRTFEMKTDQFHTLRYNVARVLKEFDNIEKSPSLKIDKKA
eukprot:TRINITY_DN878_c0_g1_i1.p1 TRINITY_DN878_c0_g1~~TRINITY_DN878_c0_g1_i1.p1  ORF type:complete len:223 (+),score=39.57 TRINITY_DN878_c0_g1_i1:104-772(+)